MNKPSWFFKAKKPDKIEEVAQDVSDQDNANLQGGYTDHHQSPYSLRMQVEPMHGDELEAFEYAIKKLDKKYPDHSYKDLIDEGLEEGWFVTKKGMLYVAEEMPA